MLRAHRSGYIAFAALLIFAGALSAAELVLVTALRNGSGMVWSSFTPTEEAVMRHSLYLSEGLFMTMGGMTIGISLVLVYVALKGMMTARRREFGQLRLLGASPVQLRVLTAAEAGIFSTLVLTPAVVLGAFCARPLFLGLQRIGFFGNSIELEFGFPALWLTGLVLLFVVCVALAGALSIRPRDTHNVIEAAQSGPSFAMQRSMGRRRVILGASSVVLSLTIILFTPNDTNPVLALLLPLLVVLPLGALAPVLVPPIARLLAYVLAPMMRGVAVLVGQRARREARRFSSNVLPFLVLLGVIAGFAIGSSPDKADLEKEMGSGFDAPFVAHTASWQSADAVAAESRRTFGVAAGEPYASTQFLLEEGGSDETVPVFNFADFEGLAETFPMEVLSGSLAGLDPTKVVSARETDQVGDAVTVSNGVGDSVTLQVAATVDESAYFADLVMDWVVLGELNPTTREAGVFLSEEAAESLAKRLPEHVTILSKKEVIEQELSRRQTGAAAGNIGLFGTVYSIAAIALVQGLAASVFARRREFTHLRLLGASRVQVMLQLFTESIVLTLTSGLLVAAACGLLVWRYFSVRSEPFSELLGQVPWGQLLMVYGAIAGLFILTVIVSGMIATRNTERHERSSTVAKVSERRKGPTEFGDASSP